MRILGKIVRIRAKVNFWVVCMSTFLRYDQNLSWIGNFNVFTFRLAYRLSFIYLLKRIR